MMLHPTFIHMFAVKAAKFRRRSAERPNECELRRMDVNDEAKARFLRKRETILRFTLPARALTPRREKVTDQVDTTISHVANVTEFVCDIKGATYQIATGPEMSRPW